MFLIRSVNAFVCLLMAAAAALAEPPLALLDRAIKAHGGEAQLQRTYKGRFQAKWKGRRGKILFEQTWDETFDLPARYRRTVKGVLNGVPFHNDGAMTENQGWLEEDNAAPQPLPSAPVPIEQQWYAILPQLLVMRGPETRLTSLDDYQQDGRTLAGLRAVSPDGSVDEFFDKTTGLLARARRPLPNVMTGETLYGETLYRDYRTIQGVQLPMTFQASIGDAYALTVTFTSVQFLDTIDPSVFARPEMPASAPAPASSTESPSEAPRSDSRLIVATLIAGTLVGAVWLLVRVARQHKEQTPPS